ncbi:MAG: hypothetical protein HRT73_14065, partial [Flavobacteriales bacterium]|nr:hypothetical protein [Flavobacteriales bacterium]
MIKKSYTLLFLVFINLVGFAQLDGDKQEEKWMEDNIFLDGVISDYYTEKSISGVNITASAGGKTIAKGKSDEKGEYKLVLEYDKIYTISFSKAGFTSKTITMNTNGVPDIKREKVPDMGAEITLFKPNDCIKSDMLNSPIGSAIYYPKKNVMDWDMDYSMPRLEKLNKMLNKCAKEAEKAEEAERLKEKEYNSLMKTADKSFTKEDYKNALAAYKNASTLYPNESEPKSKIKLIETELAKKAEAEKQRTEEKARAEAEKKAIEKAETAKKKEEEERLAKEKAKAEVLVKTKAEELAIAAASIAAKKTEAKRITKENAESLAKEITAKIEAEVAAKKAEKNTLIKAEAEQKQLQEKIKQEALAKEAALAKKA